jgi:hypothetical protein
MDGQVNVTVSVRNDGAVPANFSIALSLFDASDAEVGSVVLPSRSLVPSGATQRVTCHDQTQEQEQAQTQAQTRDDDGDSGGDDDIQAQGQGQGQNRCLLYVRIPVVLWSIQHPATYTLQTRIVQHNTTSGGDSDSDSDSDSGGESNSNSNSNSNIIDTINTTIGFRRAAFTTTGFQLNSQRVVLRGFSDHNSFAGVGVETHPRINLYRAQMLRALGGTRYTYTYV